MIALFWVPADFIVLFLFNFILDWIWKEKSISIPSKSVNNFFCVIYLKISFFNFLSIVFEMIFALFWFYFNFPRIAILFTVISFENSLNSIREKFLSNWKDVFWHLRHLTDTWKPLFGGNFLEYSEYLQTSSSSVGKNLQNYLISASRLLLRYFKKQFPSKSLKFNYILPKSFLPFTPKNISNRHIPRKFFFTWI